MEDEAAYVFLDGGGGLAGRNVSQLRQCLYKCILWMPFELKSGNWKSKIQQNNLFILC